MTGNDRKKKIIFEFREKRYKVGLEAYDKDFVILTHDKTNYLVKIASWDETTMPPTPQRILKTTHFHGEESLEELAKEFDIPIATEIQTHQYIQQKG